MAIFPSALSDGDIATLSQLQIPEGGSIRDLALERAVVYWPLDEESGFTAFEEFGVGDGTYVNTFLGDESVLPVGSAATFDGLSSEIVIPGHPTLQRRGDMSISFWMKASGNGTLIECDGNGGLAEQNLLYRLRLATDRFVYQHENSPGNFRTENLILSQPLTLGVWTHIGLSRYGNVVELYVNGVSNDRETFNGGPTDGTSSGVTIGSGGGNNFFNGSIDEVLIYSEALNAQQWAALADAQRGRYVEIEQDGLPEITLTGEQTTYTDTVAPGTYEYCVSILEDGVLSTDSCCTVFVAPSPGNLSCLSNTPAIDISWDLSADYDSYELRRDGNLIATPAILDSSFSDLPGSPGIYNYRLVGVTGEVESPEALCTIEYAPPVEDLICTTSASTAELSWSLPGSYDFLEVSLDGEVVQILLLGEETASTLTGLEVGTHTIEVSGVIGTTRSLPAACMIEVYPGPALSACCSVDGIVTLNWDNLAPYDLIEVSRGGSVIATLGSGAVQAIDGPLGAGSYEYTFRGFVAGQVSVTSSCVVEVLNPISITGCSIISGPCDLAGAVELNWSLGDNYNSITVERNGDTLIVLSGDTTTYTDSGIPLGSANYTVTGSRSSTCASVTANCAETITSADPVSVTGQPTGGDLCNGSSFDLSVAVSGTGPIMYEWRRNGIPVPGADAATFSATLAGTYDCQVTNVCGSVFSSAAVINLLNPIVISEPPQSREVCFGSLLELSVGATGTAPLSYSWSKDGEAIPGADGAIYSVPEAAFGDAGGYTVTVTNSCGSETTSEIVVDVLPATSIVDQPNDQNAQEGESVVLSVVAEGTGPFEYQWFRDDNPLAGATGAVLLIDPASPSDSGTYYCVVTGGCSTVQSDFATIFVEELIGTPFLRGDANDDGSANLADAIYIINWRFTGGPEPVCFDSADVNDDSMVNIADTIFLINFFFVEGPPPLAPFPNPGVDPTFEDMLPCEDSIFAL